MERPIPMDRLLSGDVGFGKTEVAVRAAFKAIQDGKQVAMLVPTTLLVKQHLETFTERFAGFPVKVRPLSRFQTDKEATDSRCRACSTATVDMVIGTHRIAAPIRSSFKDLGLDDHRRGAALRRRAQGCPQEDEAPTSTSSPMSATPIPRTLEMAVTGIREMSTLAHAAGGTGIRSSRYVGPRSGQADRRGHPARDSCAKARSSSCTTGCSRSSAWPPRSRELVPEARIAVAHGQLGEHQLEQVVDDFWERKLRRAGLHHDHRDRPRHLQREHDHHRPRRQVRPLSQLHQLARPRGPRA